MREAPILLGGDVLFKCRLCGAQYTSAHCPSIVWTFSDMQFKGKTCQETGHILFEKELHQCESGSFGVADIVSFKPDEPKEKT